jgi:hypothetical protein
MIADLKPVSPLHANPAVKLSPSWIYNKFKIFEENYLIELTVAVADVTRSFT